MREGGFFFEEEEEEMPTEDTAAGRRAAENWLLADIMGTRPVGIEVIKLHSAMASPLVNSERIFYLLTFAASSLFFSTLKPRRINFYLP